MRGLLYISFTCLLALLAVFGRQACLLTGTVNNKTVSESESATPPAMKHKETVSYEAVFQSDYTDAISFITKNHAAFNKLHKTEVETKMLKAIVFPELLRYSLFRDFFETEALALGYVEYGAEMVDFSIGRFQMKPSFVEKLEEYVKDSKTLGRLHHDITVFSDKSAEGIRKERVERLGKLNWQVKYLECFYDITSERLMDIQWQDDAEKLRFYATAYNHDFDGTKEEIEQWADARTFPYGANYKGGQYAYSDISVYFFIHHLKPQEQ